MKNYNNSCILKHICVLQSKKSEVLSKGKELQWTWSTLLMTDSAVGSEYVMLQIFSKLFKDSHFMFRCEIII